MLSTLSWRVWNLFKVINAISYNTNTIFIPHERIKITFNTVWHVHKYYMLSNRSQDETIQRHLISVIEKRDVFDVGSKSKLLNSIWKKKDDTTLCLTHFHNMLYNIILNIKFLFYCDISPHVYARKAKKNGETILHILVEHLNLEKTRERWRSTWSFSELFCFSFW